MKVNSEHLYEYINDLATDEKVKFKVYYDDDYVTEIYWNGESFEWDTGTFTSEAFFNPMYDFEVIEEDKKIEENKGIEGLWISSSGLHSGEMSNGYEEENLKDIVKHNFNVVHNKINEIIVVLNEMREDK